MMFVHEVFQMNQLDYLVFYKNVVHDYLIYHPEVDFLNKINPYIHCLTLIFDYHVVC
jgi:hypothetical protein